MINGRWSLIDQRPTNMKQLLLIRHAKSSWSDFSIQDFDRPLNDRGKRDAPVMAKRMLDKGVVIDAFLSSPALRARKTAEIFAREYKREKDSILFFEELYLAQPPIFFQVIQRTDDRHQSIAVFSHNQGITDFANLLTPAKMVELPTCGILAMKTDILHWKDFKEAPKEFWFFSSPKSDL